MSGPCKTRIDIGGPLFKRLLVLRSALADARPGFSVSRAAALRAVLLAGFPVVESGLVAAEPPPDDDVPPSSEKRPRAPR